MERISATLLDEDGEKEFCLPFLGALSPIQSARVSKSIGGPLTDDGATCDFVFVSIRGSESLSTVRQPCEGSARKCSCFRFGSSFPCSEDLAQLTRGETRYTSCDERRSGKRKGSGRQRVPKARGAANRGWVSADPLELILSPLLGPSRGLLEASVNEGPQEVVKEARRRLGAGRFRLLWWKLLLLVLRHQCHLGPPVQGNPSLLTARAPSRHWDLLCYV